MKKISICPVRGWILSKLAMVVANRHGTENEVTLAEPYCAREGYINFYCDIFNTYKDYKSQGGTHVGFFTHMINWEDPQWLKDLDNDIGWSKLDGIITMTREHGALLRQYGYTGKLKQIIPGNFKRSFNLSPVKILIAQRGDENHYGQDTILELLEDLKPETYLNLDFIIIGDGWEPTVMKMRQLGISVEHWKDTDFNTSYPNSYQQAYDWCDYVLVPMHEAAGPMCLYEAMACGKPAIIRNIGWAQENTAEYYFDTTNDLRKMLDGLVDVAKYRRDNCPGPTWESFAKKVVEFIAEVDDACNSQQD